MSLHWYACISINTDFHMMYDISLETIWWVLSNTTLIMEIHLIIPKIIANEIYNYWLSGISVICCHFCISYVRNRPATKPVTLKVYNVKLSFDIWLVLYMYFILYSWHLIYMWIAIIWSFPVQLSLGKLVY